MTPSDRARGGGGDATGILLAIIVAGVAFLLWTSWQLHHAEISAAALRFAHWEMQGIGFVSDRFRIADAEVLKADPGGVRFGQLLRLYRNIGAFFLYPAVGLAAVLSILLFNRAGGARFSRRLDLEGLMREQARSFPHVSWMVGRKLGLVAVRSGEPRPADPALRPAEWAALWASGKDGAFDEAKARHELARQLGEPWRGVKGASPAVRCMLAVFALHGQGEKEDALELLGLLSASLPKARRDGPAGPEKPLAFPKSIVDVADRVLSEAEVGLKASEAMGRHFYTTTGLMTALCEARARAGVLAPAAFACLKLVDRRLWWALHSLGFESEGRRAHPHPCPRVEAIGARSHWEAEGAGKRPLAAPEFDSAIAAIRAALHEKAP